MVEVVATIDRIKELLPLLQAEPARDYLREWLEEVTLELNEYEEWAEKQPIRDDYMKLMENGGLKW